MWEKEGEYQTIMEAELEYCAKRGWGMNNAAVEVFNNLMAGVRDGWFFKIRRKGLDELEFLRWAEELRLEIAPLASTLSQAYSPCGRQTHPRKIVCCAKKGRTCSLGPNFRVVC